MELLCVLAEKVIEFTLQPIGRQLGYLISYHSNVKKLKDEFKELQNDIEAVQHLVDDAQRQGEDIEVKVQEWFSRVNEITELVDKFYGEETHANTNCSFKSCPNLWLRHQISRKAKKMTLEVAEVKEKGRFDRVSFYKPPDLVGVPYTSSSTADEGMESRISIMSQVLEALADPNVDMVGLCGLPGVGKTTLAKEVATKAKEQKLFDKVVWVTIAQNPDLKGIQTQIADNVGMKLDVESVHARASYLNQRLKNEKNLLVVLDDLWERLDLHQVGIPFENDENNKCFKCTILLTSRNEDLLYNQMNCKRNVKMDVMSEEESLNLFKENAELSDDSNHIDLLPMAVQVVQQCGGLPLAIVAVARSLKNKRKLSEWRCALNQLKRPLRRNMTGIKEVDSSLMFSYDHLDTELQSIFLLSAMLSHDPLIIDLLMYSMGLSLLQDVHSMKDAQDAMDVLVSKLKASSLLLDSFSNDRFTMHDVFREFSLSVASKEQHCLVVSFPMLETLDLESINFRISSIWDDHLPNNSFGNLKTLIVKSCGFLVKLVPLHVLISLSNLEELEVNDCWLLEMVFDFDDLNSYKKTQGSWIVPLKKINLFGLPRLMHVWSNDPQEIFSFQRLRQVKAVDCQSLKSMFPGSVAKGMFHLQELELYNCGIDVIVAKAQVSESGAPTFIFHKLNKLQLWHLPNMKNVYVDRHTIEWPSLQSLCIRDCDELEVIPNLKMMSLDGQRLADMLWNDQLGFAATFFNLKELTVCDSGFFTEIFLKPLRDDCFQMDLILPNLESLYISNCDNLIKFGPSFISFKNLTNIDVGFCKRLTSLLTSSTATSLVQLTRLRIYLCNKIEEIIAKEGDDDVENEIINFKKLRSLELEDLPSLKSFCSHNYAFMFPSLDKVTIRGCYRLSMFCPRDIHAPLLKGVDLGEEREELWVTNLNKTIQLLFLPEVVYLKLYPEMKNLWVEKLPHHKPFSKLEMLTVDNCDFLREYVIPAHLVKCLSNLIELEVRNCHSIKTIFDVKGMELDKEALTSLPNICLGRLELYRLPNLKCVWTEEHDGINCFQNLQELYVGECENLRNIFVASTAKGLAQLDKLEIESCELLEVIPRLEGLTLNQKDATMIRDGQFQADLFDKVKTLSLKGFVDESVSFPYSFLERFPYLKQLRVEHSCFEEILPSEAQIVNHMGKIAPFKKLHVGYLDQLKTIWNDDSQLQPIHQDLESLQVESCGSLIKLTPSFASLKNLKSLKVSGCHQLIYLLTSSTAKSLVNLRSLVITDCERIEEIVTNESEDVEATFTFDDLNVLVLTGLRSLTSFSSQNHHTFEFPYLQYVTISGCHQMKIFCPGVVETPILSRVEIGEDESSLKGDLNKTIELSLLWKDATTNM
ncbi:putative disease resistance protein [Senna tora]|uniref:Putative disease resistance protein n=1 Tax=Senna tora TaxID=362788 RepID=A0A835CIJ6_9FABA|nr:putative disease resistance protein [Senna tora]